LASTTPTGFSEGVSIRAIEKGLLGRFLLFFGDHNTPAQRLFKKTDFDIFAKEKLKWLVEYQPTEETLHVGDIPQLCDELKVTKAANDKLSQYFNEFDALRRQTNESSVFLPIIARLYQMMVKLVMISAISNHNMEKPIVNVEDVEFGYKAIMYHWSIMQDIVPKYIHDNRQSADHARLLKIIDDNEEISKQDLVKLSRFIDKRVRDSLLLDLIDSGEVSVFMKDNKTFLRHNG
jgi:hypothetical protein